VCHCLCLQPVLASPAYVLINSAASSLRWTVGEVTLRHNDCVRILDLCACNLLS
jgi:hypothetical protein